MKACKEHIVPAMAMAGPGGSLLLPAPPPVVLFPTPLPPARAGRAPRAARRSAFCWNRYMYLHDKV